MALKSDQSIKRDCGRGAWTAEEDLKLAQVIETHGAKRWRSIASIAGLNRCGKSCRMRWMNYLRPNIKRGNISDQEEDLILRLHKLLGNRWSLIAGRLPGRTDNEIKNYWNSHLSKKVKQKEKQIGSSTTNTATQGFKELSKEGACKQNEESNTGLNVNDLFDFSNEGPLDLEWVRKFLDADESFCRFSCIVDF